MKARFPIKSKLIRVVIMVAIGLVLVLILTAIRLPRSLVTGLTAFILYFAWQILGGKW